MSRDNSIDALRGLAIVLVVVGHAIPDAAAVFRDGPGLVDVGGFSIPVGTASSLLLSVISSFHMPLFAFVSGLVMWPPRGRSVGEGIVARVRSLLVPYFGWFAVLFVVDRWSPGSSLGFVPALTNAVVGRGGLWFLYALFICTAVVICLAQLPGSRWILPISALIAIFWPTSLPNVLYLSRVLLIYPFVVLGYMVGPLKGWVLKHRVLTVVTSLAAFIPLLYLRHPFFIPGAQPISRLPAAVERMAVAMHAAGIRGGFALGLSVTRLVALVPFGCACAAIFALLGLYLGRTGAVIDVQAWFGRKSLGIYAVHGTVLWWLVSMGLTNTLALALVALGVSAAVTALLERVPILDVILLGRRTSNSGRPHVVR